MGIRKITRTTVVAHTKDGRSIRGVLVGVHRDSISLASAAMLQDADLDPFPLDGDVLIPRDNVAFIQAGLTS